ncbi:MAG: U32 family peptidase [Bacteroidales bacterium]|nr:U32 family peptidase [Bacteroidales bacterium]
MRLELLSPAKNLEFGREAINHGADALYIGAPAYGARAAATNTLEDIEALVNYAHLYGSKVFVTVNTLLFDHEIEPAVKLIHQLYNIGVDALLIQDLGLLECDLPPIELHASTQCHNASVERIKFLEQVGFRRVVLARETSLEQMREIRKATRLDLEAFVHGALCVSYSGQCYMSQYLNNRSGNRGCCSQPCRSTYDLYDGDGHLLLKEKHLLSLRDFNASQQLGSMIAAGITSFKIEGRLKDLSYVKNITAYYRQLLDSIMNGNSHLSPLAPQGRRPQFTFHLSKSSSGSCTYTFAPDPDRTFNRGYTDYFLRERQPMANFATQKSLGKLIGKVTAVNRNSLIISGTEPLANGDGLCYYDADGHLQGFLINGVQGRTVTPNQMPDIKAGTTLWRNQDQLFEKQLQGKSAERKIGVEMLFSATPDGFALQLTDEEGLCVTHSVAAEQQEARNSGGAENPIVKQLSKLGNTPFVATAIVDETQGRYFLPAGTLNQLRREAVDQLIALRIAHHRPADSPRSDSGAPYPTPTLDYRANVINEKSEAFYKRHGVNELERGLEQTENYDGKALMTTKYCLRYELGCCLQGKNSSKPQLDIKPTATLLLRNNDRRFRLDFDCQQCQMLIYKEQ